MSNNLGSTMPAFDLNGWRERFIFIILRLVSLVGIFAIVVSFPISTIFARIVFIGTYLALLAATLLKVKYAVRVNTLLLTIFIIGANALLSWGPWADGSLFLLTVVILSTIFLDRHRDILFLIVSTLTIIAIALLHEFDIVQTAANVPAIALSDWAVYIIDFIVVGAILLTAASQFKKTLLHTIESMHSTVDESVSEKKQLENAARKHQVELETRMEQVRMSSNAIRSVANAENVIELLDTIAKLISEKFGYYHVGVFILDEQKRNAFAQASSSAIGAELLGRAFRLSPDKTDPLSSVVTANQPAVMSDAEPKSFFRDANFPLTRSRMILPLAIRHDVIGLLDIHSDQSQAISTHDAEIMQTLADLTAISFENIRLITETKSLISQLEINTAIQTKRTWTKLTSKQKPAYQYTPAGVRPIFSPDKRVEAGDLLVPLMLQGQKIGTIKLKRKGNASHWSEREQVLVEKIADQVALALENSRLVEEAQRNALQDQMIANISTQIRETLDIEAVIRTASTELRRVFDLKEAEIVVGPPQSDISFKRNTSSLGKR